MAESNPVPAGPIKQEPLRPATPAQPQYVDGVAKPSGVTQVAQDVAKPSGEAPAPKAAPEGAKPSGGAVLPFLITTPKSRKRWFKGLIYGEYGVGKTTLAASSRKVESMRDVIFIDAESGDLSLYEFEDIDTIRITDYKQFARVHEFLRIHCAARDAGDIEKLRRLEAKFKNVPLEEITRPKKYRTVVIDSITEVQKFNMYQLLGIDVGEVSLDVEPQAPEWAEWGKTAEMIRLLIRSFRDLPMHVIFVSAAAIKEDDKKRRHFEPSLPGKLANDVQGALDLVGYMVAAVNSEGGMSRRLYIQPGRTFRAKNRFRTELTHFDKPEMADLAQYF